MARKNVTYKVVDYWLTLQALHGGPNCCCPEYIRVQLRLARSSYRRQYRNLKRGVASNIADIVTTNNCFQKLHKNPKSSVPAMIDKYSETQLIRHPKGPAKNVASSVLSN